MSYSITPENRVLKDGEDVGYILDGVCYTDNPPKGRGIASFRAMAGNPELQFKPSLDHVILPTSEDVAQWTDGYIPDGATILHPTISSAAGVDDGSVMEPVPVSDDAGAGILSAPEPPRSAVLGDRDPEWQRWFVATRGEDAFKAKWPARKLP